MHGTAVQFQRTSEPWQLYLKEGSVSKGDKVARGSWKSFGNLNT